MTQDETYMVTVDTTPALLVAMGRDSGALSLSLTDPSGNVITAGVQIPAVFYTETVTQTLYSIANPQPGNWQITVGNRNGNENYLLQVLGAAIRPTIVQPPVLTPVNNGYTIAFQATGAPTATYSLFYDVDASGRDGLPIATGLPLSQTTVDWQTQAVVNGSYYVYALVDDPFNAPLGSYSAAAVTIANSTLPAAPSNLQVKVEGSNLLLTWSPITTANIAGYRIYYREPNGGSTFVTDLADGQLQSYLQQGIYLDGNWAISISSYDINGNESTQSPAVTAKVGEDGGNAVDNLAPTVSIAKNAQGLIEISAVDEVGGSGVDKIYYALDAGQYQLYQAPLTVANTVSAYADDMAGNRSAVVTYSQPNSTFSVYLPVVSR